MKRPVIGFVSKFDPSHDRVAWSGTIFKLREAIELAGFDLIWIPYNNSFHSTIFSKLLRCLNKSFWIKGFWLGNNLYVPFLKEWANQLDHNPNLSKCDYLFFPGAIGITLFLKKQKPSIYLADATFQNLIDYYPSYTNINN